MPLVVVTPFVHTSRELFASDARYTRDLSPNERFAYLICVSLSLGAVINGV